MKAVGIQPNQSVYFNGVTFTWANATAGQYDNYTAIGQTIPIVPAPNATTLGFIGSASNGTASGTATLTYTDGSTQPFTLTMTDWTLGSGSGSVAAGNQKIATMTSRNTSTGVQKINVYLFYADVALQSGKTLKSITLSPTRVASTSSRWEHEAQVPITMLVSARMPIQALSALIMLGIVSPHQPYRMLVLCLAHLST